MIEQQCTLCTPTQSRIKWIYYNQQKREWQAFSEILIWEFKSAPKAIGEVMCGENESESEQKRKQQVIDQLFHLPPTELINLLWRPGHPNSIWRLLHFFIRVPTPFMLLTTCCQCCAIEFRTLNRREHHFFQRKSTSKLSLSDLRVRWRV
jgi:hypothetical protein